MASGHANSSDDGMRPAVAMSAYVHRPVFVFSTELASSVDQSVDVPAGGNVWPGGFCPSQYPYGSTPAFDVAYIIVAVPICRRLLRHWTVRACRRAAFSAGMR